MRRAKGACFASKLTVQLRTGVICVRKRIFGLLQAELSFLKGVVSCHSHGHCVGASFDLGNLLWRQLVLCMTLC